MTFYLLARRLGRNNYKMEKLVKCISEKAKPVELFLDDLKIIIDIFSAVSTDIKIKTPYFKFKNVDELLSLEKEKIYQLSIRCNEPYISLDFQPNGIHIYAAEDTPSQRGVVEQIKHHLKKRKRKFAFILHSSLSGVFTGLFVAPLMFIVINFQGINYNLIGLSFFFLFFGLLWSIIGNKDYLNRFSRIYLKKRINQINFIQRNKDQIAIAVLSAFISAVFTFVATNYFIKNQTIINNTTNKTENITKKDK